MTNALRQAIAEVQMLPEDEQEIAGEVLRAYVASRSRSLLSPAQVEEVKKAKREVRQGKIATERQVARMWKDF